MWFGTYSDLDVIIAFSYCLNDQKQEQKLTTKRPSVFCFVGFYEYCNDTIMLTATQIFLTDLHLMILDLKCDCHAIW